MLGSDCMATCIHCFSSQYVHYEYDGVVWPQITNVSSIEVSSNKMSKKLWPLSTIAKKAQSTLFYGTKF